MGGMGAIKKRGWTVETIKESVARRDRYGVLRGDLDDGRRFKRLHTSEQVYLIFYHGFKEWEEWL